MFNHALIKEVHNLPNMAKGLHVKRSTQIDYAKLSSAVVFSERAGARATPQPLHDCEAPSLPVCSCWLVGAAACYKDELCILSFRIDPHARPLRIGYVYNTAVGNFQRRLPRSFPRPLPSKPIAAVTVPVRKMIQAVKVASSITPDARVFFSYMRRCTLVEPVRSCRVKRLAKQLVRPSVTWRARHKDAGSVLRCGRAVVNSVQHQYGTVRKDVRRWIRCAVRKRRAWRFTADTQPRERSIQTRRCMYLGRWIVNADCFVGIDTAVAVATANPSSMTNTRTNIRTSSIIVYISMDPHLFTVVQDLGKVFRLGSAALWTDPPVWQLLKRCIRSYFAWRVRSFASQRTCDDGIQWNCAQRLSA